MSHRNHGGSRPILASGGVQLPLRSCSGPNGPKGPKFKQIKLIVPVAHRHTYAVLVSGSILRMRFTPESSLAMPAMAPGVIAKASTNRWAGCPTCSVRGEYHLMIGAYPQFKG